MLLQILALTSLGLVVSASACPGYQAAQTKCETDYPVTGVDPFWDALYFYTLPNLHVYCNSTNKDNFKNQVKCVTQATRDCLDDEFKNLVADDDNYVESINNLCSVVEDYNSSCTSDVLPCVVKKPDFTVKSDGFAQFRDNLCKFYKYIAECATTDTKLGNCAETKTQTTYLTIVGKLTPEVCSSGNGAAEVLVTSGLLILSIFISLLI